MEQVMEQKKQEKQRKLGDRRNWKQKDIQQNRLVGERREYENR